MLQLHTVIYQKTKKTFFRTLNALFHSGMEINGTYHRPLVSHFFSVRIIKKISSYIIYIYIYSFFLIIFVITDSTMGTSWWWKEEKLSGTWGWHRRVVIIFESRGLTLSAGWKDEDDANQFEWRWRRFFWSSEVILFCIGVRGLASKVAVRSI